MIEEPVIEELEPIGGTGDTITGIAAALVASGMEIPAACAAACRANRIAGLLARPTPATQIHEIIANIPKSLGVVLREGRPNMNYLTSQGVTKDAI